MKIIGEMGDGMYICEVSQREIQKYMNAYYNKSNVLKLAIGSEIDLAKGHDFLQDSKSALSKNKGFYQRESDDN